MLEGFLSTPLFVLIAFEKWSDILNIPAPDRSLVYATTTWHFARAIALAGTGKTAPAEDESKLFLSGLGKLPRDAVYDPLNSVADIARVQENLLAGMIASSNGEQRKADEFVEKFRTSITAEDALNYNEPPSWFPPVRPILGEHLLAHGRAAAAEKVFRDALEKLPRYPRALIGLRETLKMQKRFYEAELVDQQLRELETAAPRPARHRR